jgi:glutamate racemase
MNYPYRKTKTNMIGFLDSGVGGLTVLEEVRRLLPKYGTLYLGDTAHAPYGNKSHKELVRLVWRGCERLFEQGCDLIIIACNSASASALREIQRTKLDTYPSKRILGVIRPTVETLCVRDYRRIIILSTEATKKSGAYVREFEKLDPAIEIISHACPNWAPMIEAGKTHTQEMRENVERELREAEQEAGEYDAILLACTHYPYVKRLIEQTLLKNVPVYTQGDLVAESLKDYLHRHPEIETRLSRNGTAIYETTGDPEAASSIASKRFGFDVRFERAKIGTVKKVLSLQ